MFLESSRYDRVPKAQVRASDGREVTVVTLRRLPVVNGAPKIVQGTDRLDVMAHRQSGDATQFWRIADANTELWANDLVREAGREIEVPES